jgi:hypothetical protein
MVIANTPDLSTSSWVCVNRFNVTEINGGSSEMDVKELTVIPYRCPSWMAVTTATPVVHARMAPRSCSESKVMYSPMRFHHNGDKDASQDKNDLS